MGAAMGNRGQQQEKQQQPLLTSGVSLTACNCHYLLFAVVWFIEKILIRNLGVSGLSPFDRV